MENEIRNLLQQERKKNAQLLEDYRQLQKKNLELVSDTNNLKRENETLSKQILKYENAAQTYFEKNILSDHTYE